MKQINFLSRAAACVLLAAAGVAHAASYDSNLIANGDAESGTSGWTAYDGTALFQSVDYGSNWVLPSQPGPSDRGGQLFVGGSGVSYAAGFQTVDLSANLADIASGKVAFSLTGYLGGWTNQGDNAFLGVSFLGADSQVLGFSSLGPVTPDDRGNQTGLFYQQAGGYVPVGTTQVLFELSMERLVSGDNDGYADNLSFVMSAAPVPEPQSYALMALGLVAVGAVVRRKKA
jgi:PEP-CTERM motif